MSLFLLHFSSLLKLICTWWTGSWNIPAMPTTGHASGVNVTADSWCTAFLEEERVMQEFSSSLCHVTAVVQGWHTRELREWWQLCWKSCSWALTGAWCGDLEFAAWCGDLVSPGQPAWAFQVSQKQCSCRELCWGGLLLQAGSGAQGGDEQDRILVELLGAGFYSAPRRVDTSLAQGTDSHVLHRSAAPSGWTRWSAGLEGHLLGDSGCWFSSPVTPYELWVKHN